MTARISILCHGSTASNRISSFPADEPLDNKTMDRTRSMKGRLDRADRVLISPLLRTRQTAEALGFVAATEPALKECDYARWSGIPIKEIADKEPDALAEWMNSFDARPHGGEALSALFSRVAGWLQDLTTSSGHILVITHASIVRACILHTLQAPAASFWRIDVQPLSVTQLSSDGRRWALRMAE